MKSFNSIETFIKHYEFKNSIPAEVQIALDVKERRYIRGGQNQYAIEKGRLDRYKFTDFDDLTGTLPQLKVNYLRYFELKKIVEAYFLIENEDGQEYLSPIYFNDTFITADDFKQFTGDDTIEQFNLKWVKLNEVPSAFQKERAIAYKATLKSLFYEFEAFKCDIQKEMKIKSLFSHRRQTWEQKWDIDLFTDKSPYFTGTIEPDDFW
ncbi:hypothetical protein VQ056_24290 [Paenibacillus sp. JTLBN-2024]